MKTVMLDGYTVNPGDLSWDGFKELGDFKVYDRTDPSKTIERIGDAEIALTNKTVITREIIEACPNLKYIGVFATGYNIIDCDAAKEKGIVVTNVPTYGTNAVGQFAIGLLLEICFNIGHHNSAVHEGRWSSSKDFCFWDYPLIELAGKTIGIVGFGRIGQVTGSIAKAIGMNVLAFDTYQSDRGKTIAEYVDLDALYSKSDVVVLHCPLTKETDKIINKSSISKMKDGVIIINNSRGQLVNEQDLADALNSGKVFAAGLDVLSSEPVKADNPLLKAKNCIITPHISWAAKECRERIITTSLENLKQYLGGNPINIVNL